MNGAIKTLGAVIISGLLLQGCSSKALVNVLPKEMQTTEYQSGYNFIINQSEISKNIICIGLPITIESGNRIEGVIFIKNNGQTFTFDDSSIKAKIINGEDENEIHIYNKEELIKEEKRQQTFEKIALAFAAFGNAYNASRAGYHTQTGTFHGNYGSTYGTGGTFSGYYTTTTYNAYENQLAQQQAMQINQQMISSTMQNAQNRMSYIENYIVESKTLINGDIYGAKFVMDDIAIKDNSQIIISTSTIGDHHEFQFGVEKIEN